MAIGIGAAIAAGALAAGSSLGSTAIKAATDAYQNDLNRKHEIEKLRVSNALERELRSTQYQDVVADMKAAGINPAALGQTIGQVSAASPNNANTTGAALAFGANNILLSAVQQTALDHKNRLKNNVRKIAISTAKNINRNL